MFLPGANKSTCVEPQFEKALLQSSGELDPTEMMPSRVNELGKEGVMSLSIEALPAPAITRPPLS